MNKRVVSILSLSFAMALLGGCEKPTEGSCKQAVVNIRQLMGTSKLSVDTSADASWIRSCRGSAKKKSVNCAIAAKSLDGLKACGLLNGAELDELVRIDADLKKLRADAMPVVVDAGVAPLADAAAMATDGDGGVATPPGDAAAAPMVDATTGTGTGTAAGTGSVTAPGAAVGSGAAAVPAPPPSQPTRP